VILSYQWCPTTAICSYCYCRVVLTATVATQLVNRVWTNQATNHEGVQIQMPQHVCTWNRLYAVDQGQRSTSGFLCFFFCFPVFLAVPADTKIFNKTKGFGVSQHLLPGYHMSEEALGLAATWYDLVWTPSKVCIVEGTCTFVVTIH
jgi:hypothetical protein